MSKIPIKFAQLKTPLFLGKKNHKMMLDASVTPGLGMVYDREHRELLVTWGNETAIVPREDVASMNEGIPTVKPVQYTHPMVAGIASAQVSTPNGHVHAGPGKGKK